MNILEGASRMQRAGRALVIIALAVFALCVVGAGIFAFLPEYLHVREVLGVIIPLAFGAVWICAMAFLVGGLLWVSGWILEGFHNNR